MDAELKAYLDDMRAGMMAQIGEHFEVFETRITNRLEERIDAVEGRLGRRIEALRLDIKSLDRRIGSLE